MLTDTPIQFADNPLAALMSTICLHHGDEGYISTCQGLSALLTKDNINKQAIDALIVEIDQRLSRQMDTILHHPEFQALESAWRGAHYVVEHTDFRENSKVDLVHVTKQELQEDFADASELSQSGLYKLVYSKEYGQFGGEPYGCMIGQYTFSHHAADVQLLQNIAGVAAMAHAPFIAAAAPTFFGVQCFSELPHIKDLQPIFAGAPYAKWRSFRASENARYVGLTAPRFLLRLPYHPEHHPVRGFHYQETAHHHADYLWGNTACAFATRIMHSFAQYRWCPNIIGPQGGGAVEDLPLHFGEAMGDLMPKIPTEVMISDRREYELAEQGFIALAFRKGSDKAAFFSANSTQSPQTFGISEQGKQSALNVKLGTQLPYLFVVCRIAHYLKVLQREQIGTWKERSDLERELNLWLNQYVANQENAPAHIRSMKPLREARVTVDAEQAEPGWYGVHIEVRPHFKYMGSDITLSLTGRLETEHVLS